MSARLLPRRPVRPPVVAIAACVLLGGRAPAQDDADDAADEAKAQAERVQTPESAFDSWVFRYGHTAHSTRMQLEKALELELDGVDHIAKLTGAERSKLRLAGQGDIQRYFESVEVVRRRFLLLRKDREKLGEILRDIQPLQQKLTAGIFDDASIFRKTLRRTLGDDRMTRYETEERDRRAYRFRAEMEWVVAMMENVIPLREEQRASLIRLLVEETKLPRKVGEHDVYVILWQLSRLPEDKLKPILDEAQWEALNKQFTQMKWMEDYLKKNGWLSFEGDAAAGPESKPAPAAKKD